MDTKQNNYAINEFKGGMNSDLSYDVLQPNQYVFGENIRITTNALISQINNSNTKEGSLSAIPEGVQIDTYQNIIIKDILAAGSIGEVGVILTRNNNNTWSIYKITKENDVFKYTKIFTSTKQVSHDNKFSIVLNKEIDNDIILYIADGINQMMCININNEEYYQNLTSEDQLISGYYFPQRKINITETIVGNLKTGQIQYTYRFYKKRGIKSKLAPLTNKLQVIDSQKTIEEGNAENTTTGMGFKLLISVDDYCLKTFDKVQVYRIYYSKSNVDSEIELIYDGFIENRSLLQINDTGIIALERYNIDEFNTLDGLQLIPQSIEQNQNYMFAANVEDITKLKIDKTAFDARSFSMNSDKIICLHNQDDIQYNGVQYRLQYTDNETDISKLKNIDENLSLNKYADINLKMDENEDYCRFDDQLYYGGIGSNVSWRFITTPILIHDEAQINNHIPPKDLDSGVQKLYYLKYNTETKEIDLEDTKHYTNQSVFLQNGICENTVSYENPVTSSLFRSLKRDEVYRYGIILYDNYGRKSDVQWIADIRTPSFDKFNITKYDTDINGEFSTNSVLTIKQSLVRNSSLPGFGSEEYVNDAILNQIQQCKEDGVDINIAVSQSISYYTPVYKSSLVHLKRGQKIKLSIYRDSVVRIYGFSYQWYTRSQPGSIVTLFPIEYRGQQLATNSILNLSDLLTDQTQGHINNIELKIVGKLVIPDLKLQISPYEDTYYEVPQDCHAYIEHYCSVNYNREEYSYEAGYLMLRDEYLFSDFGQSDIQYYLEVLNEDQEEQKPTNTKKIKGLISYPLGIQFNVHDLPDNISAYQIVRCDKPNAYTKNLLQCVAARPIRQKISKKTEIDRYSPYYPHYILNAQPYAISTSNQTYDVKTMYKSYQLADTDAVTNMGSTDERNVFQLYSPEITLQRNTTLQKINRQCNINFFACCFHQYMPMPTSAIYEVSSGDYVLMYTRQDAWKSFVPSVNPVQKYDKSSLNLMYTYYFCDCITHETEDDCNFEINGISDVLNPHWESGFSNVQLGSGTVQLESGEEQYTAGVITFATKNYKSYISTVHDKEFLNWHCNGMYNMKAYKDDADYGQTESGAYMLVENIDGNTRKRSANGLIGPGPICYVVSLENKTKSPIYKMLPIKLNEQIVGTSCAYICNVTHKASQFAGYTKEDKKYDIYYGFGNFVRKDDAIDGYNVFDGDIYITPFEIVQMYKAYDFNDKQSLLSGQFVYYVAIESSINNFFNYGYNYTNTSSKNIQIDPGEITGIAVQERPSNQYNTIYSSNNTSNDIYNTEDDEDDINLISQRIYYSNVKTSGENIDQYSHFSPLNYIDVDTRYGEITNILSNKDILYCWQDNAFGRIHVNERSLISDQNNNTIQLGTGGVMQRIDYIDLHYGMSKYQHAAVGVEDKIYWIDDKNKAILVSDGQRAINLSEQLNVQNIINERFNQNCPEIHYDVQNQELLCKCLNDDQIVFNTKLNVATSLYTRKYLDILTLNNTLYGIDNRLNLKQYNNIAQQDDILYMPSTIKFVVNTNASTTKVFDNQELVLAGQYSKSSQVQRFIDTKQFTFSTNISDSTKANIQYSTREGNIEYTVPRVDNAVYGNRQRGKWMCVEIKDKAYNTNLAISHIITKFRQSFS